jgi:hypothetical protein
MTLTVGKTKMIGEGIIALPLSAPKIPHGLACE